MFDIANELEVAREKIKKLEEENDILQIKSVIFAKLKFI